MPKDKGGVGDSAETALAPSYGNMAGPPPGGRKNDPRAGPSKLQGQSAAHPKHKGGGKQSPLG